MEILEFDWTVADCGFGFYGFGVVRLDFGIFIVFTCYRLDGSLGIDCVLCYSVKLAQSTIERVFFSSPVLEAWSWESICVHEGLEYFSATSRVLSCRCRLDVVFTELL